MVLQEDVLDTFIAKLVEKVNFSTVLFQEKKISIENILTPGQQGCFHLVTSLKKASL